MGMSWEDVQANKKKNPLIKAVGGPSAAVGMAGVARAAGPVNKNAYMLASRAVRGWAKKRGIDPIKATKALSETTREAIDEVDHRILHGFTKPAAHITPTLKGIAERVSTGNRSGRTLGKTSTSYQTRKGYALDRFGANLGAELGQRSGTVLRPKPSAVFARNKARKKGANTGQYHGPVPPKTDQSWSRNYKGYK